MSATSSAKRAVGVARSPAATLTDDILAPIWRPTPRAWLALVAVAAGGTIMLAIAVAYTVLTGIGVWGNNMPVAWAFAIVNFVWWIGIGHAGTFISAFLLLLEQDWRSPINRLAEAMTLFAIAMAGLFPLLHLGRPWFFYWLFPYPSTMGTWPQFRSALPWDAAAIMTYGLVSLLFWYLGLIPDLATARDRAPRRGAARAFGVFALGWRGSSRAWYEHRIAYGILAALAAPLVVSVHSIVSMDFAIAQLPGWHSTIFPPYFVVGAIFSGFAMVLVIMVPLRRIFDWTHLITHDHLEAMAKLLLVTGTMMLYAYAIETFFAWYSGDAFERYAMLVARPFGHLAIAYWAMLFCNAILPQALWSKRLRRSPLFLFVASVLILVGMWLERLVIIVSSLERDFLPSSWHDYSPTVVDWTILAGTLAAFSLLMLLFIRIVPAISIHEMKRLRMEQAE